MLSGISVCGCVALHCLFGGDDWDGHAVHLLYVGSDGIARPWLRAASCGE